MATPAEPLHDPETLDGFMDDRAAWLHLEVVPGRHGWGWDVVLRIDGAYAEHAAAVRVREYFHRWLRRVLPPATRARARDLTS